MTENVVLAERLISARNDSQETQIVFFGEVRHQYENTE